MQVRYNNVFLKGEACDFLLYPSIICKDNYKKDTFRVDFLPQKCNNYGYQSISLFVGEP